MTSPLTAYRNTHDMSVEDLAALIGVDRTTVWRWEKGRVPVERLGDVWKATGIPRQDLRPDIFEAAQ